MIGDLRLFISRVVRQHITCKHDYKVVWRKDLQGGSYEECRKCGKSK